MIPAIDRYRLADCTLFRTPALDFSPVEKAVEKALLDAWNRGYGPEAALSQVSSSEKILGQLAGQIEDSLKFQRQQAIEKLEAESEAAVQSYDLQKSAQIGQLQSHYGSVLEEKNRELGRAASQMEEARRRYDAVHSSLARIRSNVDSRLGKIGGEQGYDALNRIRDSMVYGTPAGALTARIQSKPKESAPEKPAEPLEAIVQRDANEAEKVERKNAIQRFVLAVWSLFEKGYTYWR